MHWKSVKDASERSARRALLAGSSLGPRDAEIPLSGGVALCSPPRSGQGVGVVIPNLLSRPDSVVSADIKPEDWHFTSGFRAISGRACFLFSPLLFKYLVE